MFSIWLVLIILASRSRSRSRLASPRLVSSYIYICIYHSEQTDRLLLSVCVLILSLLQMDVDLLSVSASKKCERSEVTVNSDSSNSSRLPLEMAGEIKKNKKLVKKA